MSDLSSIRQLPRYYKLPSFLWCWYFHHYIISLMIYGLHIKLRRVLFPLYIDGHRTCAWPCCANSQLNKVLIDWWLEWSCRHVSYQTKLYDCLLDQNILLYQPRHQFRLNRWVYFMHKRQALEVNWSTSRWCINPLKGFTLRTEKEAMCIATIHIELDNHLLYMRLFVNLFPVFLF